MCHQKNLQRETVHIMGYVDHLMISSADSKVISKVIKPARARTWGVISIRESACHSCSLRQNINRNDSTKAEFVDVNNMVDQVL